MNGLSGGGELGAVELPVPGHHSDGVLAFFDIAARDLEEALVGLALAGQHDDRVGGAGQAVRAETESTKSSALAFRS